MKTTNYQIGYNHGVNGLAPLALKAGKSFDEYMTGYRMGRALWLASMPVKEF